MHPDREKGNSAMKFVVASYGTRGDIGPCAAIDRELLRRGHQVRMAVPSNLMALMESARLEAVPYGPGRPGVHGRPARLLDLLFGSSWKIRV
ncbi:glycosyltransferase [Mycobacterium tilburgii]|uniref:glycosyltransferase n=1 Tax=Mycobacterium tilburgii TaxID=44467 RepID=UPI0028C44870|nr:glycosyltransferase [Mycobacterium tilburgii]